MTPDTLVPLAVLTPFLGVPFIIVAGGNENLREAATLITATILFAIVAWLFPVALAGERPTVALMEMFPGLSITLTLEPLGMIFAGVASFLWIVTTVYAIGYMRGHGEKHQTRFYAYFAVAIGSAMGVAMSGNMLTMFFFYELLTVSTFPLVAHHGSKGARNAGRIYLGILIGTSICFLLFAVIWTYFLAGTLDFKPGGILADTEATQALTGVLLALYVFGIGKAALMPFHRWLPAAMVAPTPVSALLHAVAVVKTGVFSIVKVIVYIFGFDHIAEMASTSWLAYVAGLTIVMGSVVALRQDNLKRRLAYSTISQLSYVIIAAAILTPFSIMGAAIHIAAHAFGKITLFFAAGSIMVASHKTQVSQLDGIGRRMPITMAAFTIGALSMIGVPPTAGFVSKWYILNGAISSEHVFAILAIILSTLLNAGYFLPIIHRAYFRERTVPESGSRETNDESGGRHNIREDHGEAPLTMLIAIATTAGCTIIMFLTPGLAIDLATQIVGDLP